MVMWESDDREAALKTILGYGKKNMDMALGLLEEGRAEIMGLLLGVKADDYDKISNAYELGRLEEDAELIEEVLNVAEEFREDQNLHMEVLRALKDVVNAYYDLQAGKSLLEVGDTIMLAQKVLRYNLVNLIRTLAKKIAELQSIAKERQSATIEA